MQRFEGFVEVEAPVERVFDMLADFERYPGWMRGIRNVRRTGRRTTHWVAETALDVDVEWDAETTVFNPDRRIVWRAFRGDIHADGEAVLAQTERGTTIVRYVIGYDTPAGRSGERAAHFFGEHPQRRLERGLARFKYLAEGREGELDRGAAQERRRGAPDDRRPRDAQRDGRHLSRRHESDERRTRAFDDEQHHGFDDVLHEARRNQIERMKPYERERRREREVNERDSRGREQRRYAMTPREREMERERERKERRGYEPGWFDQRGIDHLLDEPPSRQWRR